MARTLPVTTYQVPGNLVTAGVWNNGPKALNDFLINRPAFRAINQVATSVASGTWTAVPLSLTYIDTDGGHNNVTNNTRYTCQVPGWYWVKGTVAWNGGGAMSTNRVENAIAKNGFAYVGSSQFLSWGGSAAMAQSQMTCSALVQLNAGDFVEVWGRQNSGSNQLFDQGSSAARQYCELLALWVHS